MPADSLASPYVITATSPGGLHQQTRWRAVGALALARSWDELGYTGVTVRDPADRPLHPGALRHLIRRPTAARVERRR